MPSKLVVANATRNVRQDRAADRGHHRRQSFATPHRFTAPAPREPGGSVRLVPRVRDISFAERDPIRIFAFRGIRSIPFIARLTVIRSCRFTFALHSFAHTPKAKHDPATNTRRTRPRGWHGHDGARLARAPQSTIHETPWFMHTGHTVSQAHHHTRVKASTLRLHNSHAVLVYARAHARALLHLHLTRSPSAS